MISWTIESDNAQNADREIGVSNKEIAIWLRFLKQLRLPQLFSQLSDKRQRSKIRYSNTSLALWAFSTLSFRQGSKHAFQTTLECLLHAQRMGVASLLMTDDQIPHSSTVDDYLRHLDPKELNDVLLGIFRWGMKSKLFYNHISSLSFENRFLLGCDGFWTHTYSKPHSMDEHGNNICPYCLPRRRNKGTPKEEVYWVHVLVTFVVIFRGGVKIPLYIYPLKACQVDDALADDVFKQECELKATHAVLPVIKEQFPRTSFTFCGDALYANEPTVQLLNSLFFDYLIVRKDKTLKSLGKHCDELANTELYQKAYRHTMTKRTNGKTSTQNAQWFNDEALGRASTTNVLRFEETTFDCEKMPVKHYRGEWICAKSLSAENCLKRAEEARSRWDHEDLHNTCKNRGFAAKHDMARNDPNLCLIWKMMLFIAFSVFELFRCLKLTQDAIGRRSWEKFARDLFRQLIEADWSEIMRAPILQKDKVQFRFYFATGP